jgi:hypothetical protein
VQLAGNHADATVPRSNDRTTKAAAVARLGGIPSSPYAIHGRGAARIVGFYRETSMSKLEITYCVV